MASDKPFKILTLGFLNQISFPFVALNNKLFAHIHQVWFVCFCSWSEWLLLSSSVIDLFYTDILSLGNTAVMGITGARRGGCIVCDVLTSFLPASPSHRCRQTSFSICVFFFPLPCQITLGLIQKGWGLCSFGSREGWDLWWTELGFFPMKPAFFRNIPHIERPC